MMMDLEIIKQDIKQISVSLSMGFQSQIVVAVLIAIMMDIVIQQKDGRPPMVLMYGHLTQLSGQTLMLMDLEIRLSEQLQTVVSLMLDHRILIDTDALIQMVMVLVILMTCGVFKMVQISGQTIPHNGLILTMMDMATIPMGISQMGVLNKKESTFAHI